MDNDFGLRLQAARRMAGYRTQGALADVLGVSDRTVRNWETGKTQPDGAALSNLRKVLGDFDVADEDVVRAALRKTRLIPWRQEAVHTEYQRQLWEQDQAEGRRSG